jgi:hypothetical protein
MEIVLISAISKVATVPTVVARTLVRSPRTPLTTSVIRVYIMIRESIYITVNEIAVKVVMAPVWRPWVCVSELLIVVVKAVSLVTLAPGSIAVFLTTRCAKVIAARVRVIAIMVQKLKDIMLAVHRLGES